MADVHCAGWGKPFPCTQCEPAEAQGVEQPIHVRLKSLKGKQVMAGGVSCREENVQHTTL